MIQEGSYTRGDTKLHKREDLDRKILESRHPPFRQDLRAGRQVKRRAVQLVREQWRQYDN